MGALRRTVTAWTGPDSRVGLWRLDVFWLGVGVGVGLSAGALIVNVRSALEPRFLSRLGENLRWALLPIVLIGLLLRNPFVVFASWTTFGVTQFDCMVLRRRRRDSYTAG